MRTIKRAIPAITLLLLAACVSPTEPRARSATSAQAGVGDSTATNDRSARRGDDRGTVAETEPQSEF
jgi:hypothetical protein